MSRVNTNNVSLRYAVETSLEVAPTSGWRLLEPNSISSFGEAVETVARRPISNVRGRRKGTVVNATSGVEFEADLTMSSLSDFAEGFVFAEYANVEFDLTHSKLKGSALNVTSTGYALGAQLNTFTNGTLLAGKMVYASGGAITLVFARGYAIAANNGLKALNADVTGTSTEVTCSGLSAETAPAGAVLEVAGIRTDDLTLTISGSTATLVSAGDITNWATYGLLAGQYIHIGSSTSGGAVQNAYSSNAVYGYARIVSISGGTLNLDKLDSKLTGGPHSPATIDVMFGRFLRNVSVDANSNDNRYVERTYQFEASYPDLGGVGTPEYEYAKGNYANQLVINLPLADKATATWGFIGTSTDDITATRKTGPSSSVSPAKTAAVGTSTDIASLTTDVVSSASDVCFKDITVTINNNDTPEKCLGVRASSFINSGLFEVNIEGQMLFTNKAIVNAVKNNTTVTAAFAIKNQDGAAVIDLPSMTFGGGDREYPVDASVLVNITGETFTHPTLGYDIGLSFFAMVPTIRS